MPPKGTTAKPKTAAGKLGKPIANPSNAGAKTTPAKAPKAPRGFTDEQRDAALEALANGNPANAYKALHPEEEQI